MKQQGKPWMKFAAYVCRVLFALSALALLLCSFLLHMPEGLHIRPYAVISGSMMPAIPQGSMVFVDTAKKDAKPGDIMTYRQNGGMTVTHRVYEVRDDGSLLMKGDANAVPDLYAAAREDLIGTVVGTVPMLGTVFERPAGRLILAGVMAVSGSAGLLIQVYTEEKGAPQK